ncbi:MAG: hypothetical protein K2J95_02535 [Lachnospiraceae bacterium]|nr:hypothetical protein [Lachnospiraceae bacterium]
MKKNRNFKILSIMLCLGAGILFFAVGNVMQVNAYLTRPDEFEEAMEMAKQYENNIILDVLGLKSWYIWPSGVEDQWLEGYDEALGEYDENVIRQYTNREISVEVAYGLGDTRDGRRERGDYMIQYIKVYEEGKLIHVCAYAWCGLYIQDLHDD